MKDSHLLWFLLNKIYNRQSFTERILHGVISAAEVPIDTGQQHTAPVHHPAISFTNRGFRMNVGKGDGVKSLTTMAVLSQTEANNRIIIVDEPENHLHPEAIRYLRQVLYNLAEKNQIIISTHSPIFVNRCTIQANIIVDKNEAKPACRVDDIRKLLGVMVSDNLIYSDYVIIVEGLTDSSLLKRVLGQDGVLAPLLQNNTITVRAIAGVNNLKAELYSAERYLCHYIVLLDNDDAGKSKAKEKIRKNLFYCGIA